MSFFGDIADFFGDIGEFFVDAFETIKDWLYEYIVWTAELIVKIMEWIAEYWYIVLAVVVIVIAIFYAPDYIPDILETLKNFTAFVDTAASYVVGVEEYIGTFLEAIHFQTLLALNSVVSILVPEYGNLYRNFLYGISKISGFLFGNTHLLTLFFRNARLLVLDAGASIGKSYDLADLEWFSTIGDFLKSFNDKAILYKDNPTYLLWDLDNLVIKPAHNLKAGVMANILQSIDGLANGAVNLFNDIGNVNNDLARLVSDLPNNVRSIVQPYTNEITNNISSFIANHFTPAIGNLNAIISTLSNEQAITRSDLIELSQKHKYVHEALDGLGARLTRPGTYISEINDLSDDERQYQELLIAEIVSRPAQNDAASVAALTDTPYERLAAIKDILGREVPSPSWYVAEAPIQRQPGRGSPVPRSTWYVGDY